MRTVVIKSLAILLTISLMQAGLLACCSTVEKFEISQKPPCHQVPKPSHSCCAARVVPATAPALTDWKSVLSAVPDTLGTSDVWRPLSSPLDLAIIAASSPPWTSNKLATRLHVFLI